MTIKQAADAAIDLRGALTGMLDSGELNDRQRKAADTAYAYATMAALEIEAIMDAETFPYITCGEFMMHGGIVDIGEEAIQLVWGLNNEVVSGNAATIYGNILAYLSDYAGHGQIRMLMVEVNANKDTDELRFSYAIESKKSMHAPPPHNGIGIITPAGSKREHGAFYEGKAYFRNPDLRAIPEDVYAHKLKGFAFPYNLTDPGKYIPLIESSADVGGELADLRAFGPIWRPQIDALVEQLKGQAWKKIYTQWKRYSLLGNGTYRTW